ncbi:unnamed protein product [Peniophora sp. CBMAI 1063]|nr:unnamed protein product [Peniophora sp. CBMAI 1063]
MSDNEDVLNIQPKKKAGKQAGPVCTSRAPPSSPTTNTSDDGHDLETADEDASIRSRLRPRSQQQQPPPPPPRAKSANGKAKAAAEKEARDAQAAAKAAAVTRAHENLTRMDVDEAERAELEDDPLADAVDDVNDFSRSSRKFNSIFLSEEPIELSSDDGAPKDDSSDSGADEHDKRRKPTTAASSRESNHATAEAEANAARKRAGSDSVNIKATVPKKKRNAEDDKANTMRKGRKNLKPGWEIEDEEEGKEKAAKKAKGKKLGGMQDSDVEMDRDDIKAMSKGQRRGGNARARVITRVSTPTAVDSDPEDSGSDKKPTTQPPARTAKTPKKRRDRATSASGALSISSSPAIKTGVGKDCLPPPFKAKYGAVSATVIEWAHTLKKPWDLTHREDRADQGISFEHALAMIKETFDDPEDKAAFANYQLTPGAAPFTHLKQLIYRTRGDLLLNGNKFILNLLAERFELKLPLPGSPKVALARVQKETTPARVKRFMTAYCTSKRWFYADSERKSGPLQSELILTLFGFYLSLIDKSLLGFPDSRAALAICAIVARRVSEAWRDGTYNPPVLVNEPTTREQTESYMKGTVRNVCVTNKQYQDIASAARQCYVAEDRSGGTGSDGYDSTMDAF